MNNCQTKLEEPKIELVSGFVSNSSQLFDRIKDLVVWDERLRSRKTASYGVAYNYSGMTYPAVEMLDALIPICDRIEEQVGFMPNNCLLNYYPDGNSTMGYHSDNISELKAGTGVAIVSLGAARYIYYRNKRDRAIEHKYLLNSGDLLYMDDNIQQHWLHAIPQQPQASERISLTFRHISTV